MKQIKFNLYLPSWNFTKTREHALLAEEMGFYSVSFGDHFYMNITQGGSVGQTASTPNLECYTALAAVASITKRVKLLTAVTPIGFRNPAVLGNKFYNYNGMGLGQGTVVDDGVSPPRIDTLTNEHAQLWMYRVWAEFMAADNWRALQASIDEPRGSL